MGSERDWLSGDWASTGGLVNITAAVWTAGFHWWRSGNKKRTQNVSEYMLVLALCLVQGQWRKARAQQVLGLPTVAEKTAAFCAQIIRLH